MKPNPVGQFFRQALLRSAWFAATVMGAALLVQTLLWAAPGDPIDLIPNGEELRQGLEEEWGLNRPVAERFFLFIGHGLQGDLGTSLSVRPGAPVGKLVWEASLRSVSLLVPALLLSMGCALLLGWWTANKERSPVRGLVQIISVAPVFLLAYLLVIAVNDVTFSLIEAGTISRPAWFALPDQSSLFRTILAVVVLALGSGSLTELHAACQEEIERIHSSGFIDAVRARGGPEWPHVLPNLIPPMTTLASSRMGFMLGGLIIVEKVLLFNGAGALMWEASMNRDYPLAMGLTVAAALVVSGANLLGDLIRVGIDPRLRSPL